VTRPLLVKESPSTALLDCGHGIGAVAAYRAMKLAIEKAGKTGVGLVGVRNSNSYANAKFYPMMALQHRMIGLTCSNAVPCIPPPGGLTPKTGTNPIAIAVPAKDAFPLVLDMSTAAAAHERIRVAAAKGEKIPLHWGTDKYGNPTDAPAAVEENGFLQPLGGYKGFGLSLMFDLLTGVLFGGAFMHQLNDFTPYSESERVSFFLGAINIEHFIPYEHFVERVDTYVRQMKECKRRPEVAQIYLPGEQGFLRERQRLKMGVPLDRPTTEALKRLVQQLAIPGIPGKI